MKYYWLETTFNYGDFSVPKFAFHKKYEDEDGDEVDEILFWSSYEAAGINLRADDADENTVDELINKYIEAQLGFLPDYEVN